MLWKNLLSVSVLVLAVGITYRLIVPASASMPVGMQHGQFPYENFSNCDQGSFGSSYYCSVIASGSTETLLTVPSDRAFILTGVQYDNCRILVDNIPILSGAMGYYYYNSPFVSGNGHRVIPAGSTLQVYASSTCEYYVEGYYAHL